MASKLNKRQKDMILMLRQGTRVVHACVALDIPRTTYYYWRKKSDDFALLADAAMRQGSDDRLRLEKAEIVEVLDDTWKENFLAIYKQLGGKMGKSAESVGVSIDHIIACVTEGSKDYDHEFAQRLSVADQVIEQRMIDRLIDKGSESFLRWYLERKRPNEFGRGGDSKPEPKKPEWNTSSALEALQELMRESGELAAEDTGSPVLQEAG